MRVRILCFLFSLVFAFTACTSNIGPDPEPVIYGAVDFHGQEYIFSNFECYVEGTCGGPPQYSLSIRMEDEQNRYLRFRIQDPNNDPFELLTEGEHFATGQHWDNVFNAISSSTFTINCLNEEQLSVVWEEIEVAEYTFSGRGYIHIKQRLELVCADSIWIGSGFAYPGDPEYDHYYSTYCEPGYYYPEQKIWFRCADSHHILTTRIADN